MFSPFTDRSILVLVFIIALGIIVNAQSPYPYSPTISPIASLTVHPSTPIGECKEFPNMALLPRNMPQILGTTNHYPARTSFYPAPTPIDANWICTFADEFDQSPIGNPNWNRKLAGREPLSKLQFATLEECESAMLYYSPDYFDLAEEGNNSFLRLKLDNTSGSLQGVSELNTNCLQIGDPYNFPYKYTGSSIIGVGTLARSADGLSYVIDGVNMAAPFVGPTIMEARIKIPKGRGLFSAFWTNSGSEFDIFEFFGLGPETPGGPNCIADGGAANCSSVELLYNNYFKNYYRRDCSQEKRVQDSQGNLIDFSEDFHVFTLEFSPAYFKFYIDGNLMREDSRYKRADGTPIGLTFEEPLPNEIIFENYAFPVLMNVGSRGWRPYFDLKLNTVDFDANTITQNLPAYLEIDYLRIFHKRNNLKNHDCYAEIKVDQICFGSTEFSIEGLSKETDNPAYYISSKITNVVWTTGPGLNILESSNKKIRISTNSQYDGNSFIDATVSLTGECSQITIRKQITPYDLYQELVVGSISEPFQTDRSLQEYYNPVFSSNFLVELDHKIPRLNRSRFPYTVTTYSADPSATVNISNDFSTIQVSNLAVDKSVVISYKSKDEYICKTEKIYVFQHVKSRFKKKNFKVFPNPTSQFATLENIEVSSIVNNVLNGTSVVQIWDKNLSQVVKQMPPEIINHSIQLNLDNLLPGLYYIKVITEGYEEPTILPIIKQ